MDVERLQTLVFFAMLLGAAALVFFIIMPYLGALILAATMAVVFAPLHRMILRVFGGREALAALAVVVIVLVIILLPLSLLGYQVFQEVADVYRKVTADNALVTQKLIQLFPPRLQSFIPQFSLSVNQYAGSVIGWVSQNLGGIFSSVAQVFVNFFIGMLALYYFLRDGARFKKTLYDLSPLAQTEDEKIFSRLETTVNSVIKGSLLLALIQGILAGTGFAIFGVPNAAFWGAVTVIAALVPTLGTTLIIAPAVLYLFFMHATGAALGLLIWGVIAVGLVDNVLGPKLYGRGVAIHPLFILLAVLGGLALFGPVGFLIGPLVVSFLFALLDIYPSIVARQRS